MTRKAIKEIAKRYGLVLTTHNPGDRHGTRYGFFREMDERGALYGDLGTYCGAREASCFLRGFMAARDFSPMRSGSGWV